MIDYFDNEKGDVTITLYDEPIAICKNKQSAEKLISAYKSLTMRVDVLSKMTYTLAQAGEVVKREMPFLYDEKLGFDNVGTKVVKLLSRGV
jgi:hypothetical protein